MGINEYVNSPEFNRTSRNVADSGIKMFFKGVNATVMFLINFIKEMFRSIIGR